MLVSLCQRLILVTIDKKASTLRSIYFTFKEYLSAYPDIFSRPRSAMAEACMNYRNFKQVKAIPPNGYPALLESPPEYCLYVVTRVRDPMLSSLVE